MFYRTFKLLAKIVLRLFFRQIDAEGLEHVPATGPLLLVVNHTNALVDPLLPITLLHRRLTPTMKDTLGRNPLVAAVSWCTGAIAFHRAQDTGKSGEARANVKALQRCREMLKAGGAICIFPEGISHSDLTMREFQAGAAHIAIDYVRKEQNAGKLKVVPVGLLYTSKGAFRSGVWVRFGEAIDVEAWLAGHDREELTAYFRQRIEALTLSYRDRREMLALNWANEVLSADAHTPGWVYEDHASPSEVFLRLARLREGYRQLETNHSDEIGPIIERISAYRRELKSRGISPVEVNVSRNPLRVVYFLVRELELMVLGAPIALAGLVAFGGGYAIVRAIAQKLSVDKDHWASNVIYPSLAIFPILLLVELGLVWWLLPAFWAVVCTIALPYSLYYTVLYFDHVGDAWRRASTFLYFLFRPGIQSSLKNEAGQILAEIDRLATYLPQPAERRA